MIDIHKDERINQGIKIMKEMVGTSGPDLYELLKQLHPDVANLVMTGYSDIYARPGLEKKQRAIVTLTALITQGASEQLHAHTYTALNAGLKPNEILEIIIQCTAYIGFPRALTALSVVKEVMKNIGMEFN